MKNQLFLNFKVKCKLFPGIRLRTFLQLLLFFSFCWFLTGCQKHDAVFERLSAAETGIHFTNTIQEDDQHNVFTYTNIYTGAGVAAGDINNDGLTDLFFSGSMVSGLLYLNTGNLQFKDITAAAGLTSKRWQTGATMVDINQDGWLDIYVCVAGIATGKERANLLYINNRNNTFTESAEAYGLADTRQVMHASFFDYDQDNDLDVFLIVNPASLRDNVNVIRTRQLKGESASTDVLYRNNGDNTFTDVSREAGILSEGYSLGLAVSDINNDGWPDVYISNDFISNDVLYINNQDGTFTDKASECLKHTSYAGMGNDIADINNDGLVDIVELDMRPEDNTRQKLIIPSTGYDRFQLTLNRGYDAQYSRNTLQLNQGNGKFSEAGFLAGISSTDWSWSALLADYDNDGDRDLFVTNGFLKNMGDLDYVHYQNVYNGPMGNQQAKIKNKLEAIKSLPGVPLQNYLYENTGNINFQNRSVEWGLDTKGFSNGALYADLDNDGDLELVVNTINSEVQVYENKSNERLSRNYLKVKLAGSPQNRNGIGAKIKLSYQGKQQFYEHFLSRGFESSIDPIVHFGLDSLRVVDNVEVLWPDGKYQLLKKVKANQILKVDYAHAVPAPAASSVSAALFTLVGDKAGLAYQHRENSFVDFKLQPLLPHGHSRQGPGLAVSDVNGDGLTDVYVGGATDKEGALFLQQASGKFQRQTAPAIDSSGESLGVLFFDADQDQDQDLYLVRGSSEQLPNSAWYQDELYINDGNGNFSLDKNALPMMRSSKASVVAADYDQDGDLDLFVGGRITPGAYPTTPRSYLLQNESKNGVCRFQDVTQKVSPGLVQAGMVTSALWSDYDNDGWVDLLLAGEFMPLRFYQNQHGKLVEQTNQTGLEHTVGWWNSLAGADFDQDGDIDYVAGNVGLNTRYQASPEEPLCVHAKDYNKDGRIDPILSYYNKGKRYILHSRDDLIDQINTMRGRFPTYQSYAQAQFEDSFLPQELAGAQVLCAEWMQSSYVENLGKGKFRIQPLPREVQLAPLYGMIVDDYNKDGHLDVLAVGNSYAPEVSTGRYDAGLGWYLQGNGKGEFSSVPARKSGFVAEQDAKSLVQVSQATGQQLVVVGNNNSGLEVYQVQQSGQYYQAQPEDAWAEVRLTNGKSYKHEFHYGASFLSQAERHLNLSENVVQVVITNSQGKSRNLALPPDILANGSIHPYKSLKK
ncbi:VCBS repeat-containing protein [Adhaeribacter radiodurans]|uniref:VCBS repeat-containing protein n=1 Tax=Adhaeribacter radiodurans TaxID=2745197 RepID=A0A7L7L5L7_9BACT|nr:VCBS repeat-containing protein [Adhaeribacter radiodurans]QMU28096.1 VCBS repeat-containing protein [Adhaeribacter radiodurans]